MALNCSANYVYTIIYNGYAELVPPGLSNPHITVAGVFDTLIAANRAAEEILTRGYTGVVAAASSSAKRDSWLESLKKNGSIYHAKDTGCFRMDNYCRDFWEDPDRPGFYMRPPRLIRINVERHPVVSSGSIVASITAKRSIDEVSNPTDLPPLKRPTTTPALVPAAEPAPSPAPDLVPSTLPPTTAPTTAAVPAPISSTTPSTTPQATFHRIPIYELITTTTTERPGIHYRGETEETESSESSFFLHKHNAIWALHDELCEHGILDYPDEEVDEENRDREERFRRVSYDREGLPSYYSENQNDDYETMSWEVKKRVVEVVLRPKKGKGVVEVVEGKRFEDWDGGRDELRKVFGVGPAPVERPKEVVSIDLTND